MKAIVFDLDGTLLDTLDDLTDSVNTALEKYGFPLRTKEEVRRFVGNGLRNLMTQAVPNGDSAPEFEELFVFFKDYYKSHCDIKTGPYEGIMELLEELHKREIKMAIVSNKFDLGVKALNEKFFAKYIDVAIGEREGIGRKPAPDSTNEALRLLGVEKSEAVYVGDSDVDIKTAKNAEIACVCVSWGFRDKEFLLEQGAKMVISHPMELLEQI